MSDILACLILPPLVARRSAARRESVTTPFTFSPSLTVDALFERDEIDVAVSMGLDHSNSIQARNARARPNGLHYAQVLISVTRRRSMPENFIAQEHMKVPDESDRRPLA